MTIKSFREDLFVFTGRIGREKFLLESFLITFLGVLIISILGLVVGGIFESRSPNFVAIIGMSPFAFALLSRSVRRLHDLGRSGWLLVVPGAISFFASISDESELFYFFGTLFYLYLTLWPGQMQENEYGLPPRGLQVQEKVLTQKEKFKKEFFSFEGRIGRKWFLFPLLFLIFQLQAISGAIRENLSLMYLVAAYDDTEISLVASAIVLVLNTTLLIGIVLSCSTFIARRIQDIGWSRTVAVISIGLMIGVICTPFILIMAAEPRAVALYYFHGIPIHLEMLLLAMTTVAIILLVLAVKKGESGSNKFGENPVFYSDVFPVQALPPEDPVGEMER